MKVLVAAHPMGEDHDCKNQHDGELVIFDLCSECDPSGNLFIGLESHNKYEVAEVVERKDLNFESYAQIINFALQGFVFTPKRPSDPPPDKREVARAHAELLVFAAEDRGGGLVIRNGNELYGIKLKWAS